MVKFCIEKIIKNTAYPNLATLDVVPFTNGWEGFSISKPFSEPIMFLEYLTEHKIEHKIVSLDNADKNTFYPIALSFFDFDIQWFDLMPKILLDKLKDKEIKILFYYSEGDNPYTIDEHITKQCKDNNIPRNQIHFISANSEANNIDNFYHVVDDELLFRFRNSKIPQINYSTHHKTRKFTALVRMHKMWRANTMATLWQQRLYTDGYFSYGSTVDSHEDEHTNPIRMNEIFGLPQRTKLFLNRIPFISDTLTPSEHNDHTLSVNNHFNDSYINIVLESHMDVDQSGGVFLTEKTFKPIKNAQLFVLFGACGSLQLLRDMGYKTFDHILDNRYDEIKDTTKRWKKVMDTTTTVLKRSNTEIHDIYLSSKDDIIHNQKLFNASKKSRLTNLLKELQND